MDEARPGRIAWIDAAKGVVIALVVGAHVVPGPATDALRIVRMPLFLFIAGITFRPRPFVEFLRLRGSSLLVPYAVYILGIVTLLTGFAWLTGTEPLVPWSRGWQGPFAGLVFGGAHAGGCFAAFWFLTVLFFALAAWNMLLRAGGTPTDPRVIAAVFTGAVAGCLLAGIQTPLAIGVVPVALVFVWAGAVGGGLTMPLSATLAAAVLVPVAVRNGATIDMRSAFYGEPLLTIPAAIAACHLAAVFCRGLVRVPLLGAAAVSLGRASLVVLLLHQTVNLALKTWLGLPPLAILPLAILLPYLCAQAFRHAGWAGRWLLLGQPPPPGQIRSLFAPRVALR